MIDKDGNIRGKVNIVDIFIVIVLLATVALVGYRFLAREDGTEPVDKDPVVIQFTSNDVKDDTLEQLETGVPVLDVNSNKMLGSAVGFTADDATTYSVTDSGNVVIVSIPGTNSVVVTIKGTGTLDDNGFLIDGFRYGVGHSTTVFVGKCRLYGKISGIDPA